MKKDEGGELHEITGLSVDVFVHLTFLHRPPQWMGLYSCTLHQLMIAVLTFFQVCLTSISLPLSRFLPAGVPYMKHREERNVRLHVCIR